VTLPHFLRSLASRNYRLYFLGQCVSLLGNWMTGTAASWLAYSLTGSPFIVGLVFFANQIPVLLLAPFAGVWVDRVDCLKLVWVTQVLAMLQSAALAVFAFTGHMTATTLVELCFLQGMINAVDWPARQTLTYRLADEKAPIENVVALNSVTFNLARLVGPAIAGFVISAVGSGFCFAIDAASYLAVLASLRAVRLAPGLPPSKKTNHLADLRDGVRYAWKHPLIRRVLLLVPVIGLAGFGHSILAPVFARDIFQGDARTYGFLLSATGVGSLVAGVFLGARSSSAGLGRVAIWGAIIGGSGLSLLAVRAGLPLALVCFAAAGAGGALVMVASNTLIQSLVENDKRGRVMALFTMGQSLFPVGSLLVGALAEGVGPRLAILACGAVCLAAALVFSRNLAFESGGISSNEAAAG
jgi:MFS family permease